MELNTRLVEQVLGYEYGSIRAELARRGALASGVSGMGPALAAIAPRDRCAEVAAGFPDREARVLTLDFIPPARRTGGPS